MLEFLMNPSFNQDFISQLSWLGPWAVVLLTIIKMFLITIGSLLVGSLFLVCGILIFSLYNWSRHRFATFDQHQPNGKVVENPIGNNKKFGPPQLPSDYPHLAA